MALGRRWRFSTRGEHGSHLVEIAVGLLVLSVAIIGVVGAMGSGENLVGNSRQRSAATSVAQEKLERVRAMPYEDVALTGQPSHNPDPEHPDNRVTEDGSSYRVSDTKPPEPLIIGGTVPMVEDPVTVGSTEFFIHQYVTRVVDDPDKPEQFYKRIVVVTTWKYPVRQGLSNVVVESSFVSNTAIQVAADPPSPSGDPIPAEAEAPAPLETGCPGDTTAPTGSILLLSGAGAENGYTNSTSVQIRFAYSDNCPRVHAFLSTTPSDEGSCDGFTYVTTLKESQPSTVSWTLEPGDGPRVIDGCIADLAGNATALEEISFIVDRSPPTTPPNLRVVEGGCQISGQDRSVVLTWDPSSDVTADAPSGNLHGYRIYRSIDNEPFTQILTVCCHTSNAIDTERKTHASVRYLVRAYDKAGNESADSNVLSFPKGTC